VTLFSLHFEVVFIIARNTDFVNLNSRSGKNGQTKTGAA